MTEEQFEALRELHSELVTNPNKYDSFHDFYMAFMERTEDIAVYNRKKMKEICEK